MKFGAPIPGENFTSDTKNYPWHRPPEHDDLDEAIDDISKKLLSEDSSISVLTMIEMGVDIATIVDIFLTSGIGAGKWTPDFALLLAGPTSHIIYLMCKGYGIECDLGIDGPKEIPTKSYFDMIGEVNKPKVVEMLDKIDIESVKAQAESTAPVKNQGFMSMAKPAEAPIEGNK